MNTIKAVQTQIYIFLKPSKGISTSFVIFFSFTLLKFFFLFYRFFMYFLKSNFRTWIIKLSLAVFYKIKIAWNNWNLRLMLLHMSLLHFMIWKYVNFLGRKLIYDVHNTTMAWRMHKWLNLDFTCGVVVSKGKGRVG